jgi:hypothetical protein
MQAVLTDSARALSIPITCTVPAALAAGKPGLFHEKYPIPAAAKAAATVVGFTIHK